MYKLKLHLHGAEVKEWRLEAGRDYSFGRGEGCDVQLEARPGVSRTHFKVFDNNGQWTVQVLAKFGDVGFNGQRVQTLSLEEGAVFSVSDYTFHFMKETEERALGSSENLPMAVGQSMPVSQPTRVASATSAGTGSTSNPTSDFEGNDEATRVISAQPELPFLRIVSSSGKEDMIKLDGRKWIAGREVGCEIPINDRKASRRQFELSSTPQGYFIRDMGSSNGTLLNGIPLAADELRPLRSGDAIQVGAVTMHFEIRDPHFERKLMVVSPEMRSESPIVMENPYEIINYPVIPQGPGGAVRVDGSSGGRNKIVAYAMGDELADPKEKKKRKILVIGASVIVLLAILSNIGPAEKPKPKANVNLEFTKLSPKQQQFVKETFILAKNLYMQGKMVSAGEQLVKIHELLPNGYENSIAMAQETSAQLEQERRLKILQEQQRREEENRRIVQRTVAGCTPLARKSTNLDDLRRCLAPAIELNPEDDGVRNLLGIVERAIERKKEQDAIAAKHQELIREGKKLFEEAEELEKNGEFVDAIDAYKVHLDSTFPDPNRLKDKSQRNIMAIQKRLSTCVDDALREAKEAYGQQKYKEAFAGVAKAKACDSKNEEAATLNKKMRDELRVKLKEIYEESIISEGIGDIEQAKSRWKKIIDIDHPEGDYYRKARNKLRNYGAM